ncbi:MAG: D-aminoacyl-tRNA deacylase [Bacilli bacterium]|nr:D-aminoacyl-tRNA deacylase [Bacilli bacterium]
MKIIVQRSLNSYVTVDNKKVGEISNGVVLLIGFTHDDNISDIEYMIKKIINLRIFEDENHIMNKSLLDINGEILSISQFTLYGDTKKGNRPSYIKAMNSLEAKKLYELFNEKLKQTKLKVETGIFQADMNVVINNDGPVTIILESGN